MTIALSQEQEMFSWRIRRWSKPDDDTIYDAAKVCEEAGEVVGKVIKMQEGRATKEELHDELGDLLIAASVLAGRFGWTLEEVRAQRWLEVKGR